MLIQTAMDDLIDQIQNNTNVQLVSVVNRVELVELRIVLQPKRAGLVDALKKSVGGAAKGEFEREISGLNKLNARIHQIITLIDQDTKQRKMIAKQTKNPHFAKKFIKVAEAQLDKATFKRIKALAIKAA